MKDIDVPIALHLDHGKSFEDVKACCDAGFTSIMVDNSALPYEENIRESRKAVEYVICTACRRKWSWGRSGARKRIL